MDINALAAQKETATWSCRVERILSYSRAISFYGFGDFY
jgi:hypothetical protein